MTKTAEFKKMMATEQKYFELWKPTPKYELNFGENKWVRMYIEIMCNNRQFPELKELFAVKSFKSAEKIIKQYFYEDYKGWVRFCENEKKWKEEHYLYTDKNGNEIYKAN